MLAIHHVAELRDALGEWRNDRLRIGFVPTMGFLHDGHLRLVDEARKQTDRVVMSIFVNPLQFGPGEDLARYPSDPEGDASKASARGVDALFVPSVEDVYPAPRHVTVMPGSLANRWEGESRPGHFEGVLTVVAKLFNIVQPDVAVFGQKDIQQATLVRAMVRDLNFPVDIVIVPTVREPDGLALSSRNSYLGDVDRGRALVISKALRAMQTAFARGERRASALDATGRAVLLAEPHIRLDYLAIAHPHTMEPVTRADSGTVIAIAARVGPTRLIDNIILGDP